MENVMDPYLRLKNRTTYYRRKLPRALRSAWGLAELSIRFGVVPRREAMVVACRLAVRSDELVRRGGVDLMLAKSELRAVVAETIRFLTDNDEQYSAAWHLNGKTSAIPVTEQIVGQAGTAVDILLAYDAGVCAYGEPFVRERLLASGLDAEQHPIEYSRIAVTLSLTPALTLFRKALATAERHDIQETNALPLSKCARQVTALETQLLPVNAVEPGQTAPAINVAVPVIHIPATVIKIPAPEINVSVASATHISIPSQVQESGGANHSQTEAPSANPTAAACADPMFSAARKL